MSIFARRHLTRRVQTHRQIQVVVGREQRYVAQEQGPALAPLYAPDELLHLRVDLARGPARRRAPREVRPRQGRIDRPDVRPAPGDVTPLPPPPQAVSNSATTQAIPLCLHARFIMSPPYPLYRRVNS